MQVKIKKYESNRNNKKKREITKIKLFLPLSHYLLLGGVFYIYYA
jgi:hypothetical protein